MSILDTNKTIKHYLLFSIICFIISFTYELFSHGVYSNYMIFAGCVPLILGGIFYLLIRKINPFSIISKRFYNSFVLTLTMWMYCNGILEIYGTENPLVNYYIYGACLLLIFTIISIFLEKKDNL